MNSFFSKKAMAGYIVTILLVSFVVIGSFTIINWMSSTSSQKLDTARNDNSKNLDCMNVNFVVTESHARMPSVSNDGFFNITIENENTNKIWGFAFLVYLTDGQMYNVLFEDFSLDPLQIATLEINSTHTNYLEVGNTYSIMKLELIPMLRMGSELFSCKLASYPIFPREILYEN